jgi:hypothetical protein
MSRSPELKQYSCLCGSGSKCYQLMLELQKYEPERCRWHTLPVESDSGTGYKKRRQQLRESVLRHLGEPARRAVKEREASKGWKHRWASIHHHPELDSLVQRGQPGNGGCKIPDRVPKAIAERINDDGSSYTDIDKLDDGSGDYVFAPNYTYRRAHAGLERHLPKRGTPSPMVVQPGPRVSPSTKRPPPCVPLTVSKAPRLRERQATAAAAAAGSASVAATLSALQDENADLKRRLQASEEARVLAERGKASEAASRTAAELELEGLRGSLAARGGLCRANLCDKAWHKMNKHAANALFGFKTLPQREACCLRSCRRWGHSEGTCKRMRSTRSTSLYVTRKLSSKITVKHPTVTWSN